MERCRHTFAPGRPAEAAAFLRACSERRSGGVDLRVGLLESPFTRETPRSALDLEPLGGAEEIGRIGGPATVLAGHARLGGVLEVSRADLLAVCGGGATLGELRRAAAAEGLFFPYEPPVSSGEETIAGLVMAGMRGAADGRFGPLRESILSVEIATPAGALVRTGSRAVKDVAGYEIAGLLAGAGGVCGMTPGVTVRLYPEPATRMRVAVRGEAEALEEAGRRIVRAMRPLSIVFYANAAAALAAETLGLPPAGGAILAVELFSPAAGDEAALLAELLGVPGTGGGAETCGEDAWARLARFALLAAGRVDEGGGALWLAHDGAVDAPGASDQPDAPGTISWRSFSPDIRFAVRAAPAVTGNDPGDAAILGAAPELDSLLAARAVSGRHCAIGLLRVAGGDASLRLVHRDAIASFAAERPGADAFLEQARIESGLWDGIRRIFDPAGIMLP
ncbi:MAG: FAD-binding oxidoreductase [Candidatus Krumholzibacteriota bacterium]|nr:FAD-binding oxidoreductase [Candidatus Krumholzibacteriota bacterium]